MSIHNSSSSSLAQLLNFMAQMEKVSVHDGAFEGRISKGYRITMTLCSILGLSLGAVLLFCLQEIPVGILFFTCGFLILLMLPTYLSYRYYIDENSLTKMYFILCFPKKKSIAWQEISYKKIKRDSQGDMVSIGFYDNRRRKLISFDQSVVGLNEIRKKAKQIPKLP